MAKEEVLIYLQDILDAISDVESFFTNYTMRYDLFEKDYLRRSAVERIRETIQSQFRLKNTFLTHPQYHLPVLTPRVCSYL